MNKLSSTDYVLLDKANNQMVRFENSGRVIIYGDIEEARNDCYGNETVTPCTELPMDLQIELLKEVV